MEPIEASWLHINLMKQKHDFFIPCASVLHVTHISSEGCHVYAPCKRFPEGQLELKSALFRPAVCSVYLQHRYTDLTYTLTRTMCFCKSKSLDDGDFMTGSGVEQLGIFPGLVIGRRKSFYSYSRHATCHMSSCHTILSGYNSMAYNHRKCSSSMLVLHAYFRRGYALP